MKIYCQKCGTGLEYAYEKPNFCTKCGFAFGNLKVTVAKNIKPQPSNITHQEEDSEDVDTVEHIKNMSSLDVEIAPEMNRKSKIKDIIGTRTESTETQTSSNIVVNKDEFMESFKREAGFYPSRQEINEEK